MKMFYTLLPTCLICLLFLCANDQVQAQENANATLEFTSLTLGTPPASFIENGVTWGLSSTSSNFEVATSSGSNNLRLFEANKSFTISWTDKFKIFTFYLGFASTGTGVFTVTLDSDGTIDASDILNPAKTKSVSSTSIGQIVDLTTLTNTNINIIQFNTSATFTDVYIDNINYYDPVDIIWNGNNGTDWATASNWTGGIAPTSSDNAIIPDVANDPVIPASDQITINNLTIESGASLTIASDATGTGSLKIDGTLTNNGGTINQQRYIAGHSDVANKGWHFLSSPVSSQPISDFHTAGSGDDFYSWSEPTNEWINRTASGNGLNGSFETNFTVGKGYLIANQATSTKTFSGNLNTEDVNVTGLTYTGSSYYKGWNLLGNPYSSALQWGTGWTLNNIAANAQIWNEGNASYSVISSGGYIPANNGFMIYTSVNSNSVTIPKSARAHNATAWYKNTASDDRIVLHAIDPAGGTLQETILRFVEEATDGFDMDYDSYFLAGFAPMLYSIANGEGYALNTLPIMEEDTKVQLGFVPNAASGNYQMALADNIGETSVFLTDLITQTVHRLNDGPYSFQSSEGDNPDRFVLHFGLVGLDEPAAQSPAQLWFADEQLYLQSSEAFQQMELFDLQGRRIYSSRLSVAPLQQLSINNLQNGLYIVRMTGDNATFSAKVKFIR